MALIALMAFVYLMAFIAFLALKIVVALIVWMAIIVLIVVMAEMTRFLSVSTDCNHWSGCISCNCWNCYNCCNTLTFIALLYKMVIIDIKYNDYNSSNDCKIRNGCILYIP